MDKVILETDKDMMNWLKLNFGIMTGEVSELSVLEKLREDGVVVRVDDIYPDATNSTYSYVLSENVEKGLKRINF